MKKFVSKSVEVCKKLKKFVSHLKYKNMELVQVQNKKLINMDNVALVTTRSNCIVFVFTSGYTEEIAYHSPEVAEDAYQKLTYVLHSDI